MVDFQQPITTIHDYGTDADAAGLLRQDCSSGQQAC